MRKHQIKLQSKNRQTWVCNQPLIFVDVMNAPRVDNDVMI